MRHIFVDERAMITTTLTSPLIPFYLQEKKPEKAFLTLTVNYRKTIQENKLSHSKQQYIAYLMTYYVS